jgi:hypothetical protein
MTDRSAGDQPLQAAWRSLGSVLAVASGASIALVSLWSGVPVLIATSRGAIAFAGVTVVTRIGVWIIPHVRGSGMRRTSASAGQRGPAGPAGKGAKS